MNMFTFSLKTAPHKRVRGFTLVEILVVMAIMGILAAIGLSAYGTVQAKARDAKRKSDLQSIARALELYRNDFGVYPVAVDIGLISMDGTTGVAWGTSMGTSNGEIYMQQLPIDKRYGYFYQDTNAQKGYHIYARLENTDDEAVPRNASGAPQQYFTSAFSQNVGPSSCKDGCNYYLGSTQASVPAVEDD